MRFILGVLLQQVVVNQAANDLLFYVEDRPMQVSTSLENMRINAKVEVNTTVDSIKSRDAIAKNMQKRVLELVGTDVGLKTQYMNAIEEATKDFLQAGSCLMLAHNMVVPTDAVKQSSTCIYEYKAWDAAETDEALKELLVLISKMKDYTTATLLGDAAQKLALSNFKEKYVEIGEKFKDDACTLLSVVDRLSALVFPEEWQGQIETMACLRHSYSEKYTVRECYGGEGFLNVDIEVGLPTVVKKFMKVTPLNYEGYELYREPGHIFAIDSTTNQLKYLKCNEGIDWNSDSMPLCKAIPMPEPCQTFLISEEISLAIAACDFGKYDPTIVDRLGDDGILIMGKGAKVREEGRNIPQKPPLVIYSNNVLNVEVAGETYTFSNQVKIKYPQLMFSRLDATQIAALVYKGSWNDFWRAFNITDYIQYIIILIEGLLAPVTLTTAIYTFCKCKNCKRIGDTVDENMQPRGSIPMRDLNRRLNFEQNRALLMKN